MSAPYFDNGRVTLWHGDARKGVATLARGGHFFGIDVSSVGLDLSLSRMGAI